MQIRVIGSKEEIEDFCKAVSGIFPNLTKSKLYSARENKSHFRCYITVCSPVKGGMTNDETGQSDVQNHQRNNSR